VVFRNKNIHSSVGGPKQHVRYSWQVTDIDDAIEKEEVGISQDCDLRRRMTSYFLFVCFFPSYVRIY